MRNLVLIIPDCVTEYIQLNNISFHKAGPVLLELIFCRYTESSLWGGKLLYSIRITRIFEKHPHWNSRETKFLQPFYLPLFVLLRPILHFDNMLFRKPKFTFIFLILLYQKSIPIIMIISFDKLFLLAKKVAVYINVTVSTFDYFIFLFMLYIIFVTVLYYIYDFTFMLYKYSIWKNACIPTLMLKFHVKMWSYSGSL